MSAPRSPTKPPGSRESATRPSGSAAKPVATPPSAGGQRRSAAPPKAGSPAAGRDKMNSAANKQTVASPAPRENISVRSIDGTPSITIFLLAVKSADSASRTEVPENTQCKDACSDDP